MKKTLLLLLALALMVALCACGEGEQTPTTSDTPTEAPTQAPTEAPSECNHVWVDATCTTAKTCSVCAATEGEPLNHTWTDATCTTPKTCSVCAATEGNPADHTWTDATCTTPKTCSVCAATEGGTVPHTWVDATCQAPKTCSVCSTTQGNAAGHNMVDGKCTVCGTAAFGGNRWVTYRVLPETEEETGEVLYMVLLNPSMPESFEGMTSFKEYYANIDYAEDHNGAIEHNGKTYYDFWYSSEMAGLSFTDNGDTVSVTIPRGPGFNIQLTLTRSAADKFTVSTSSHTNDIPVGTVFELD